MKGSTPPLSPPLPPPHPCTPPHKIDQDRPQTIQPQPDLFEDGLSANYLFNKRESRVAG